jgi:hypothetical protein
MSSVRRAISAVTSAGGASLKPPAHCAACSRGDEAFALAAAAPSAAASLLLLLLKAVAAVRGSKALRLR